MPQWEHFAPTYSVTRPFPHARPFVIGIAVCGAVLATLFTSASVATTAYQFQSVYTPDPNATESQHKWFQRPPFTWLDSMSTQCQDTVLVAGGRYMTMNRGFIYTLDAATSDDVPLPQFSYHNSTLDDCEVAEISIHLSRAAITRNSGRAWTWGNTVASAIVTCNIGNAAGTIETNFTTQLPIVSERSRITSSYLTQNVTGRESMWYGARLTSEWYNQVALAMSRSTPPASLGDSWADGAIRLRRNPKVIDYRDLDFFYVSYQQPIQDGGLAWQEGDRTVSDWLNGQSRLPNTTTSVDTFGKSFYSLLALEFGIAGKANALVTADGARYLAGVQDTVSLNASQGCWADKGLAYCRAGNVSVPVNQKIDFNAARKTTLYAQYLCSVPREKSSFVIFYTVLLANIVFLRACWSIFSFVASGMVERRDLTANYCAGCVADQVAGKSVVSSHGSAISLVDQSGTYQLAPHHERRLSSTISEPLLDTTPVQPVDGVRRDDSPPRRLNFMAT